MDESGIANINSNPKRILKIIEEENCDLSRIYKSLLKFGEITDDLSFLKIHYHRYPENKKPKHLELYSILESSEQLYSKKLYKEAVDDLTAKIIEFPDEQELLKHLSKLYAKIGDYPNAVLIGSRYIDFIPSDNDFFYSLSTFCKFAEDIANGIEIGERLRLREPGDIRNLLNLADLYSLSKNFQRAEELLQYSLKLDPENPVALNLRETIRKRKSA
jgi:tetratricopeptide (TPR) repeat protein